MSNIGNKIMELSKKIDEFNKIGDRYILCDWIPIIRKTVVMSRQGIYEVSFGYWETNKERYDRAMKGILQ